MAHPLGMFLFGGFFGLLFGLVGGMYMAVRFKMKM